MLSSIHACYFTLFLVLSDTKKDSECFIVCVYVGDMWIAWVQNLCVYVGDMWIAWVQNLCVFVGDMWIAWVQNLCVFVLFKL